MKRLQQLALIEEPTFRSKIPLVARVRTMWNNVAARWYVQGMFQQQIAFNQAIVQVLTEQEERLVAQDRELVALTKRLAILQQRSMACTSNNR